MNRRNILKTLAVFPFFGLAESKSGPNFIKTRSGELYEVMPEWDVVYVKSTLYKSTTHILSNPNRSVVITHRTFNYNGKNYIMSNDISIFYLRYFTIIKNSDIGGIIFIDKEHGLAFIEPSRKSDGRIYGCGINSF
jgi:hypothetical protein